MLYLKVIANSTALLSIKEAASEYMLELVSNKVRAPLSRDFSTILLWERKNS